MAYDLTGFAAHLTALGTTIAVKGGAAMEEAMTVVEAEAKRVLGTHDYGWPELRPETIARKTTGDSPLLETGRLRDSIHHSVEQTRMGNGQFGFGHVGYIYSDDPTAEYHEFGTATIPARPFMSGAAMMKEKEVVDLVGESAYRSLVAP